MRLLHSLLQFPDPFNAVLTGDLELGNHGNDRVRSFRCLLHSLFSIQCIRPPDRPSVKGSTESGHRVKAARCFYVGFFVVYEWPIFSI